MHGTTFSSNEPQKKTGTTGTESCGVSCALQFHAMLLETGAQYSNLDEWFISWGRMTISAAHLHDKPANIAETMLNRREKCGDKYRCYSLPVASFKTYLNAVCRVSTAAGHPLVMTSTRQQPNFQIFMAGAIRRSRQSKAVQEASDGIPKVLSEDEFRLVMDKQATNALDTQR